MAQRRFAVRDEDRRRSRIAGLQPLYQSRFGLLIERGGGFVENQQAGFPQDRACKHQSLSFAARKLAAAVSDNFVEAARQGTNSLRQADQLKRLPQALLIARTPLRKQIAAHAVVEDVAFLPDVGDRSPPPLQQFRHSPAVDRDPPFGRRQESRDKIDQRRLPSARGSAHRKPFSAPERQRNPAHSEARPVLERDRIQHELLPIERLRTRRFGHRALKVAEPPSIAAKAGA